MRDQCGPDDPPAACLPGEEPLLDLDTFERAGRLIATATFPDEPPAD